jgi:hypothetical protein
MGARHHPNQPGWRSNDEELQAPWARSRCVRGGRSRITASSLGETASLNSTIVTLLAFGFTFGAALVAIAIRRRLPTHHLEGDSKEFLKLVMGLIATITAMVLGLLISSAHAEYAAQESELQQLSVHLYQMDRILAHFGPEAMEQRTLLRRIVADDLARIWPKDGAGAATYLPLAAQEEVEGLFYGIGSLSPKTDLQRLGQSKALELLASVGETRRLLVEQSQGGLSQPFLVVLVSWLTILFFGFGLFARFNATVVATLLIGSLSVAGAIFLILAMNQPYGGWMQVSSAPLRNVLMQMGR